MIKGLEKFLEKPLKIDDMNVENSIKQITDIILNLQAENAALRERLEKAGELPVKECLRILHNIGGCDATDCFSRGWDKAIDTAFKAISEKYGVTAEAALDDE